MKEIRPGIPLEVREEMEKLGVGVAAISLVVDAAGKVTGGTWTGTDGSDNEITIVSQ